MAKKRKQKSVPKVCDSFLLPKSMDYSDPRNLEAMIKKTFSASVDNLRRMEKEKPGMVAAMDMDTQRCKRRVQAAAAYAPRIREQVQNICPDVPDLFSIEEEWAYINSLPTTSYDQQEERQYLVLGAAIWMLDRIKESGRRILYLSNYSHKIMRECADALYFLPEMDGGLFSCDFHMVKPDPDFFRLLIEKYQLDPSRCVFIDDIETNLEGARAVGMHTILFENPAQAEAELDRMLQS